MDSLTNSGLVNSDPGADPLVGTIIEGTYEILSRIGKGGMGSVYRAHHLHLDRTVAIKVLRGRASHGPTIAQRFRQEARALNLLQHPNIVQCYAFGFHDNNCYLVMDFIDGTTLANEIAQHGKLAPERFRKIFSQVASALQHAHTNGIVHRDLKPDNIMLLTADGNEDVIKLVDFGIAKVDTETSASQHLTQAGAFMGSPLFMSPEQYRAQTLDARSDIYSLGCVMYLAITGQAPFEGDSIVAIGHQQLFDPPPELPADVPPQLANLIYSCLEKLPDNRPPSMSDVLRDLERPDQATVKIKRPQCTGAKTRNKSVNKPGAHKVAGAVAAAAVLIAGSLVLVYYTRVVSLNELRNTCDRLKVQQSSLVQSQDTNQRPDLPPLSPGFMDIYKKTDSLIKVRTAYANALLDQDQVSQAVVVASEIDVDIKLQHRTTGSLPVLDPATINDLRRLGERFVNLTQPQETAAANCLYLATAAHFARMVYANNLHNDPLAESEQAVSILEEIHKHRLDNACPRLQSLTAEFPIQHRPDAYLYAIQCAVDTRNHEKVKFYSARVLESIGDITQDRACQRSQDAQGASLLRAAQGLITCDMSKDAAPYLNQAATLCRLGKPEPGAGAAQAGYLLALVGQEQHLDKDKTLKFVELSLRASQYHKRSQLPALVLGAEICRAAGDSPGEKGYIKRALTTPHNYATAALQLDIQNNTYLKLAKMLAENGYKLEAQKCLEVPLMILKVRASQSGQWADYLQFVRNAGHLYRETKMTEQSREAFQTARKAALQQGLRSEAAIAELSLAELAFDRRDYESAVRLDTSALSIVQPTGGISLPPNLVASCFHHRAAAEFRLHRYAESLRDAEAGLDYLAKHPTTNTVHDQAFLNFYAGVSCSKLQRFEPAIKYLYQSRANWQQLPDTITVLSRAHIDSVSAELATALRALGRESEANAVASSAPTKSK